MKTLILFILSGLFAASSWADGLDNITWVTEEYPPYNFVEEGQPKGISVELIVEVWKKLGVNRSVGDIKVYPWARGVDMAKNNPGTCLFATTVTSERQNDLGWKFATSIPLVSPDSSNHIIAKKGSGITLNSPEDLKNFDGKYGVVRGDVGAGLLTEVGVSDSNLDESSAPGKLVKKFASGRIDLLSYGYQTFVTKMEEEGLDPSQYEIVYTFPPKPMGYAFHAGTDDALVAKVQAALDELHADGTAQKILEKYK